MTDISEIRYLTRQSVLRWLGDKYGADAVTHRRIFPDLPETVPEPASPLLAIEAWQELEQLARSEINSLALKGRGNGAPWAQVADALKIDTDIIEREIEAFSVLTGPPAMRFDERYVRWTCSSCEQRIRDTGPYGGHPDDNETGHTDSCARHNDEITAYVRWLDEQDDE